MPVLNCGPCEHPTTETMEKFNDKQQSGPHKTLGLILEDQAKPEHEASAPSVNIDGANSITSEHESLVTLTFFIDGMSCTSCAMKICNALMESGGGVHEARVEFSDRHVEVILARRNDETSTHQASLDVIQLVEKLGYTVRDATMFDPQVDPRNTVNLNLLRDGPPHHKSTQGEDDHVNTRREPFPEAQEAGCTSCPNSDISQAAVGAEASTPATSYCETRLSLHGMSCASCAARIESSLSHTRGVVTGVVSFATLTARVVHAPAVLSLDALLHRLRALGYPARVLSHSPTPPTLHQGRGRCPAGGTTAPFPVSSLGLGRPRRVLITGMACASCAARLERALRALPNVVDCVVSFATGIATITTAGPIAKEGVEEETDDAALLKVVRQMGYDGSLLSAASKGVDLGRKPLMTAAGDESSLQRTRLALKRTKEIREQRVQFVCSAILSLPLVVAMILMATTHVLMNNPKVSFASDTIQLVCATPVVLYFGRQFFLGAWYSLCFGAFTMDTLVSIGIGSSYLYSIAVYIVNLKLGLAMTVYFDAAGILTSFMLLGRYLEARAKRSTSGALIELMSLVPEQTIAVTPDGDVKVPSAAVMPGMRVRVLAGERVPVDGAIVEGISDLDEQMVTGESMPKHVEPGSAVVGGTLNLTAAFVMVAEKVGEETTLSNILRVMQEAQCSKPSVQRVADRVAMYFVPFVVCTSLITLLTWLVLGAKDAYPVSWRKDQSWVAFAFNFFIATVVSACPCALGLATPTAIMVGTGVGAQHGVLVKSGTVLESVRKARCIVFDKTGTITTGNLEVVQLRRFPVEHIPSEREGSHQSEAAVADAIVDQLVVAVEALSTHPIACAVVDAFRQPRGTLLDGASDASVVTGEAKDNEEEEKQGVEVVVGASTTYPGKGVVAGVTALHRKHEVVVGNLALMADRAVRTDDEVATEVRRRGERGYTTVLVAVDGVCRLLIALSNEPKREAHGVMRALRRKGHRVLMVTGDSREVALRIAAAVGIRPEDVHAGALPVTKAMIVQQLQREEREKVMFVGDGINDSPALAQANVGVALGAGTDVALEAADAVLMHNSLSDIINLQAISSTTVPRIYANFVWAFGYNLIILPLASGALFPLLHVQVPPVLAGIAMILSSITVLLSSLSIRFFRPVKKEFFF